MVVSADNPLVDIRSVKSEWFQDPSNKRITEKVKRMWEARGIVDFPLLYSSLGEEDSVRVMDMTDKTWMPDNFPLYASELKNAWLERQISDKMVNSSKPPTPEQIKEILDLSYERMVGESTPLHWMKDSIHSAIQQICSDKFLEDGLIVGFPMLDQALGGGLHSGDLVTIASRPGVGKTAFCTKAAYNVSKRGEKVLMFCTEMDFKQITSRIIPLSCNIETSRIRSKTLNAKDKEELVFKGGPILQDLALCICDMPCPSIAEIRNSIKKVKPRLVIVDYLTRCNLPKADSLRLQITAFMRDLKNTVRETKTSCILLAQTSRKVDHNDERPPVLADLSESGSIENESDAVMFLWKPKELVDKSTKDIAYTEAIIRKNRNGPLRIFELEFHKRFINMKEKQPILSREEKPDGQDGQKDFAF